MTRGCTCCGDTKSTRKTCLATGHLLWVQGAEATTDEVHYDYYR